jgi:acid phosphatase (class A)
MIQRPKKMGAIMRRVRPSYAFVLVTILASLAWAAKAPKYIHPQDVDSASIMPGPPADDSAEHKAEIETVFQWQNKRTTEDVQRCKKEATADVFVFADVLGDWFNARSLPITGELMNQAHTDASACSQEIKKKYNRQRPFTVDDRIKPCVFEEASASYPSGHALRGILWASLLSEMFPEHRDALMARGRQFGDDRVIAGVHWPSDVEAGQKLGAEIARKLLDNPDFKNDLQHAREECLTTMH